jgi:hypothetical protein
MYDVKRVAVLVLALAVTVPATAGVRATCRRLCRPEVERCWLSGFPRPSCRRDLRAACIVAAGAFCRFVPSTTTTTTTLPRSSCGGLWVVVASDGTYLGCLNCPESRFDSIFNRNGVHGSEESLTSIHNQRGLYGSPDSSLSACNRSGTSPPLVGEEAGCVVARFSLNPDLRASVCGVSGDAKLCETLLAICND